MKQFGNLLEKKLNAAEFEALAREFVLPLSPAKSGATVVGLYGDLGAGKTSFVRFAAKALGIEDNVSSPTFVVEKIYKISGGKFERLVHIDAYRIENPEEMKCLGWEDFSADPGNLIFVEWADRVEKILPEGAIKIQLFHAGENEREIKIKNEK